MIKSELVTRLAVQNPHLYQREVEAVLNVFLSEIAEAMRNRERVELRGFGAFSVRVRGARTGRNPRTGEPVDVSEKAAPFFRAGKEMRDRINAHAAAPAEASGSPRASSRAERGEEAVSHTLTPAAE